MDDGEELVVAVELEVGDVGRGPAVNDELVEDFKLLAFAVGGVQGAGAPDGAGEAHAEIDFHAVVAHDAAEVGAVLVKVKRGHEAEAAERKGQHGRHDALEEPRGEEHGSVAAEGEDEVKLVRLAPAEIWVPVAQRVFKGRWVLGHETCGVEALGAPQLGVDVDADARVGAVARRAKQPAC